MSVLPAHKTISVPANCLGLIPTYEVLLVAIIEGVDEFKVIPPAENEFCPTIQFPIFALVVIKVGASVVASTRI